jgi:hypothetical protein
VIRKATGDGTVYRRVMDLLAGWATYVDSCAEGYPDERDVYEAEAARIRDLYQDLGSRSGPYRELDRVAYEMLQGSISKLAVLGAEHDGR